MPRPQLHTIAARQKAPTANERSMDVNDMPVHTKDTDKGSLARNSNGKNGKNHARTQVSMKNHYTQVNGATFVTNPFVLLLLFSLLVWSLWLSWME